MFLSLICLLVCVFAGDVSKVYADTYNNAYDYYNTYGNRMVFIPSTDTDGTIYYATKAMRTSSNILFSNIGWKAMVRDSNGTLLQEVYYKMDGNYLKTIDIRTASDGYEYSLYGLSLEDFKSRLDATTLATLESGNCSVVFDACIIVKRNGVVGGGMTDAGISWGTVHTTYQSIVNAEEWSTVTKNSLLSYYDKVIEGLFYTVTLEMDQGISSVTGAGTYCYGTIVPLYASVKSSYSFWNWSGDVSATDAKINIRVKRNLTIKANSISKILTVYFVRNWNESDQVSSQQIYNYGASGQRLKNIGWKRPGFYQSGWKHVREQEGADYAINELISSAWIVAYQPKLYLYANWIPNRYTVYFDANGASEDSWMQTKDVNYQSILVFPECEYDHETSGFLGWCLKADGTSEIYNSQDKIYVADLVDELGITYSDGQPITLYAIWDGIPAIDACDIYVSLEQARAGKITERYLASYASARDPEDGNIPYGINYKNYFLLLDYQKNNYLEVEQEGCIRETFVVQDTAGNITQRAINVHLVDTGIKELEESSGNVRFISSKYFCDSDGNLLQEEAGGLREDSVWRHKEEFYRLLEEVLKKADNEITYQ